MYSRKSLSICLLLILSFAFLGNVWAGQVVTDDIREWARQTVKNEKALEGAASPNTLAVLYFRNRSSREELSPLQKGLSLMLITDLSTVENLQVVERAKLQALMEEMGLGVSGLVEQGSAPRVGKLLGAGRLVGGDFEEAKQNWLYVQSRLLDVQSTSVIAQPESEGLLGELFRIEKDLLFAILKELKIEVTPQLEKKLRKPCSTRADALFALFRGIDASDKGEYEKAAELYRKALDLDPDICAADKAMNELRGLGLVRMSRRSSEVLKSVRDSTSLTNQLRSEDEIRVNPSPGQVSSDVNVNVVFPTR